MRSSMIAKVKQQPFMAALFNKSDASVALFKNPRNHSEHI